MPPVALYGEDKKPDMKHSQLPVRESAEGELQHYVHERPGLLLKMLEIAETCWEEDTKMLSRDQPVLPALKA